MLALIDVSGILKVVASTRVNKDPGTTPCESLWP